MPADIAIITAWTAKNNRCPVVTAATALAPKVPTIFKAIKPMEENRRFDKIVGHAKAQTLSFAGSSRGTLDAAARVSP